MVSATNTTNPSHTVDTTAHTEPSEHNDDFYSGSDNVFQSITLDSSHPLYLHPSDHPGQVLVTTALTGDNFNEWKRSMSLALSAKNKLGFVNGKFKAPGINSTYFNHWQRCNDMIITWIFNSLAPEIRSSLVYVTLAEDVWNDLHTRFTHNNGPRIFELKRAISDLNQETQTISAYYTKFKQLNDDLNNVAQAPKCVCVCSCTAKAQIEQLDEIMKVTQFLMGLNDSYTNIRGQLLMMNPMPKITQVLALLQQEERQRSYTPISSSTVESAALAIHSNAGSGNRFSKFKKYDSAAGISGNFHNKRGNLECSHCHGTNHTKDRCYHLIGFPPRNRTSGNPRSNQFARNVSNNSKVVAQVQTVEENTESSTTNQIALPNTLSSTQYQQLIAMLNQVSSGPVSIEPPQSGICTCSYMSSVCLVNGHTADDWILDSGATDHITCNMDILTDITPCSVNICLPNGQFALVKHKGTIYLSSQLILYEVLLIPEFHFNLISISKLISTLHVEVNFLPTKCLIQDPMNKRVMGIGNLQGNLYKLVLPLSTVSTEATSSSTVLNVSDGQLWHDRLGHTPLTVIKHIESVSSQVSDTSLLPCDVCHFAKQGRLPFNVSSSRASKPFDIVHCDLWGPYKHNTYSTCHSFLTIVDDFSRCT